MEWTKENKRIAYLIGAAILVLFTVLLMLKFWYVSLIGIVCFVLGYYFGRKDNQSNDTGKKKSFL